ncbi:trans-sulfuration enzyme family protein [Nocardioides campestrisoli]|uniref:trans-sulfuration enzyme family protein n=1 Tax=Nocardioides campestrisoli TaxID=2736757 RepID=UPI00163DB1A1|nr:PLP-dependent transferase [Nocardioides campestrisoli]
MELSTESQLIHAGTERTPGAPFGPPLVPTSTYVSQGAPNPALPQYGRNTNVGWEALEDALAVLEGPGCHAVAFPSGQAASMATMAVLADGRPRVVMPDDCYYKTRDMAHRVRPGGAEIVTVDLLDYDAVAAALGAGPAVLWAETPANPLLRVADLARLAGIAGDANSLLVVDNTVATAFLQKPLDFGAVASVYSLTKSLSGHSDVLGGAFVTRSPQLADALRSWRSTSGAVLGPFEGWLALRGLRTLPLRLARQCENALAVAEFLDTHPRVASVHYPRTYDDPLVKSQLPHGAGGLLAFQLEGSVAEADAVVAAARLIVPSTSFGGIKSAWERRDRWAAETAPSTLIRLSAGIEPREDIIADLAQALRA